MNDRQQAENRDEEQNEQKAREWEAEQERAAQ